MKRFTNKELEEKSDEYILYHIVNNKWAKLKNPHTPLAKRLAQILENLSSKIDEQEEW